jgi:hypothetical protein
LYFQKVKIDTLPLCCWWKPVVRDCGKIGPVKWQKRVGKYIVDVFFFPNTNWLDTKNCLPSFWLEHY